MNTSQDAVSFTVPLTPPSVNHYKKPVTYRKGGAIIKGFAMTDEAHAYNSAVAIFARGATLSPIGKTPAQTRTLRENIRYSVSITVYLGEGQRLDVDNGAKVAIDSLTKAGVIHSDARVRHLEMLVEDDERHNPRTEFRVCHIARSKDA